MRPAIALEGGLVVIQAPKCTLVLTAEEITGLVHFDREVWTRAVRRGRYHRRGEATARRIGDRAAVHATETAAHSSEPLTRSHPAEEPR